MARVRNLLPLLLGRARASGGAAAVGTAIVAGALGGRALPLAADGTAPLLFLLVPALPVRCEARMKRSGQDKRPGTTMDRAEPILQVLLQL